MLIKRIGVLMYETSNSKGQELVAQRMVRDFISLGHEAYLITSVYHDGVEIIPSKNLRKNKGYVFVEDAELEIPIIRVDSYTVKWPRRRIAFRDFVPILERIVDEFRLNVLITHSTLWNGPEDVAKFVAWRRYMKDVGGYEDPIIFCHMSHYQEPSPKRYSLTERTFRMAWNKFSLSQILRTANLVLVVTPLEKDAKVKMGADPKKCFLFPSGVDEEPFLRFASAEAKEFLKQHDIPEDAKLVSYLGTLEERKNPLAVLKTAKLLKKRANIHFVIAGKGNSDYADRVRTEATKLSNVTYLGEIADREKTLLIKSSFANILMSQLEALGLTQLEFMYAGVPVITSGAGGQSWLIQDGREGMHVESPEDIVGAARAITTLAEDHETWKRLSANAKEKAAVFTSSNMIRELDEAITKEMIKESGLSHLPPETRVTLATPEKVLKTWSAGSWGAVATDTRLFVKKGLLSRRVAEIPYSNITSIVHTRRYSWRTLAVGLLPTLILILDPLWRKILNDQFISTIDQSIEGIIKNIHQPAELLTILFVAIPWLIAISAFAFQARTGSYLCGSGVEPIYIPHRFSEVVTLARAHMHDKQHSTDTEKTESPRDWLNDAPGKR
jgi:D-inositol-3-phosphate glycosyltransferase